MENKIIFVNTIPHNTIRKAWRSEKGRTIFVIDIIIENLRTMILNLYIIYFGKIVRGIEVLSLIIINKQKSWISNHSFETVSASK